MLLELIQRAALSAGRINPRYSSAARWAEAAWSSSREEHELQAGQRLAVLLRQLAASGLIQLPAALRDKQSASSILHELSVLTRAGLQQLLPQLQKLHQRKRNAALDRSGGSTGEPTRFYRDLTNSTAARVFAMQLLQTLGWSPGIPRICIWGSDRDLGISRTARFQPLRLAQLVEMHGGYSPDEQTFLGFINAVRRQSKCAVYGYTGLLAECARLMLERGWHLAGNNIVALWTTAEMLHESDRELIGRAFGKTPRDFYGSRECPWLAAECGMGHRHISPRYHIEIVDSATNTALGFGHSGSLAVTDLFNRATPFIRYIVGDLGRVDWIDCSCGRRSYCLTELQGRISDAIRLASGRLVSSVFFPQLIKEYPQIHRSQLVRLAESSFEIRYIGEELGILEREQLLRVVAERFEQAQVSCLRVDQLQLTTQGKLLPYVDDSPA